MIYNLQNQLDRQKARKRFDFLLSKGKKIDLTEKTFRRTLSQNRYLHLILKYYGLQVGLNLVEVKQEFKEMNIDIFNYEKNGKWYVRSSADLDKMEMMACLDRFIKEADTNGILLPNPEDYGHIDEALNDIEKNQQFL